MELEDISLRLKEAREQRSLTLKDVSEGTHIRTHYLKAIENNEWEHLRDVYAIGYIREYARFLDLDNTETLAKHFNERFSQAPKMPLADGYSSQNNIRHAGRRTKRKPSFSVRFFNFSHRNSHWRIPALLVILCAGVIIYGLSFSSTKNNETDDLRATFNAGELDDFGIFSGESLDNQGSGATDYITPKAEKESGRVPVAFSADTMQLTPKTNYVLHSEATTTVRIYDKAHNPIKNVALLPGDVVFIEVPEGGYASATKEPEAIIVYSEDMQRKFGDIRTLLPR